MGICLSHITFITPLSPSFSPVLAVDNVIFMNSTCLADFLDTNTEHNRKKLVSRYILQDLAISYVKGYMKQCLHNCIMNSLCRYNAIISTNM